MRLARIALPMDELTPPYRTGVVIGIVLTVSAAIFPARGSEVDQPNCGFGEEGAAEAIGFAGSAVGGVAPAQVVPSNTGSLVLLLASVLVALSAIAIFYRFRFTGTGTTGYLALGVGILAVWGAVFVLFNSQRCYNPGVGTFVGIVGGAILLLSIGMNAIPEQRYTSHERKD